MKMSFSNANIDKADTGYLLNTHPENCKFHHSSQCRDCGNHQVNSSITHFKA